MQSETISRIAIWLAQCAGSFCGCWLVWTILVGKRQRHARHWKKLVAGVKELRGRSTSSDLDIRDHYRTHLL